MAWLATCYLTNSTGSMLLSVYFFVFTYVCVCANIHMCIYISIYAATSCVLRLEDFPQPHSVPAHLSGLPLKASGYGKIGVSRSDGVRRTGHRVAQVWNFPRFLGPLDTKFRRCARPMPGDLASSREPWPRLSATSKRVASWYLGHQLMSARAKQPSKWDMSEAAQTKGLSAS